MNTLQTIGAATAASATQVARQEAEQAAEQFEAILVRQLVGSLRESSSIGDEGGMFGSGTGSDTYSDWFDQHLADHIGGSRQLGVKDAILADIERAGQLERNDDVAHSTLAAQKAADRSHLVALAAARGGIDVTR
ncbi:MAG: rod-binding protein [bacterium]|nr:rod-binding protein [bacterium]